MLEIYSPGGIRFDMWKRSRRRMKKMMNKKERV
jgi:hypothetical protein